MSSFNDRRSGRGGGGRGGRGGRRGGAKSASGRPGPKLPLALLEQVEQSSGGVSSRHRNPKTRKEIRKAARHPHPQSHSHSHSHTNSQPGPSFPRQRPSSDIHTTLQDSHNTSTMDKTQSSKRSASTAELAERPKKKRKPLTLPSDTMQEADPEDGEIEWLEYILRKEGKKVASMGGKGGDEEVELDDGLDELIGFADVIGPGGMGLGGKDLVASDEESDEDEEEDEDHDEDDESEEAFEDATEESGNEGDEGGNAEDSEDEDGEEHEDINAQSLSGSPADNNPSDASARQQLSIQPNPSESQPDNTSNTTKTRYIPPHLRAAELAAKSANDVGKAEERGKVERKLMGLLNRLSEQNIEPILGEIEVLYQDHSRNDVTTIITDLVIEMVSSRSNLLDSFVILYASMVGALHRVIGMEFGAHFTHTLVTRYQSIATLPPLQKPLQTSPTPSSSVPKDDNLYQPNDGSKESLNLLSLISELYNAKVISSGLIYDLVRQFLSIGLEESGVEGLLRIVKCCGQQLRSDDPASLKDIVGLVQEKTKNQEESMTTRTKFMIESLVNLKSGKSKAQVEQSTALERMRKFLSSLGRKRRILASEPLRVSLQDLLNSDTRGKWWLVGAAWSGDPLLELQSESLSLSSSKSKKSGHKTDGGEKGEEEALLEVARKQGMNTDVRRSIFLVLMTSEDYVHACERLSGLRLNGVREREVVRVALHCADIEETYNPYYTLILSHLCSSSFDHKFTLQYALWDYLRLLEDPTSSVKSKSKVRGRNVAMTMGYIVARGGLDLTVFKAIEWTSLSKPLKSFLKLFTAYLILSIQTISPMFILPKKWNGTDEEGIKEVWGKCFAVSGLGEGWGYFIGGLGVERVVEGMEVGEREKGVVKSGLGIVREVLGR